MFYKFVSKITKELVKQSLRVTAYVGIASEIPFESKLEKKGGGWTYVCKNGDKPAKFMDVKHYMEWIIYDEKKKKMRKEIFRCLLPQDQEPARLSSFHLPITCSGLGNIVVVD